ncbi:hydroxypyruvate isomerase family protein [Pseudothioclava arenosa]|uniref:Hydroxypyruvate isomerase n=1 Tax=Pseudothioclava arenosa TaxID=1795308 RepID=A0A2A4CV06_9RHOB|nr:TIM barrel protein [Pseudothioclava arenosa]PCD77976.1 hydroxypyruvate isomerase [Pseudothioclava arenosa]
MLKFSANLSLLFSELPFMERFAAAKAAGFDAVEVQFPYDGPAQEMRDELVIHVLPLVVINAPPPNYTGGPRGFAAVPGQEARFRSDFRRVLRYAQVLKPLHLHVMAGASDAPEARACFIENLRWACAEAPNHSFLIEPINRGDMPGYFLADYDLAAEVIAEVGAPNLGLQFDFYHAQKITGDAQAAWARHGGATRHVQIAQTPQRSEPDAGEIDYPAVFAGLKAGGYAGYIGAEYIPAETTEAGIGWLEKAKAGT